MAKKGDWVKIHSTILTADQRAPQVPEDTKMVPLEMWVKGYLEVDGKINDLVEIRTVTGRKETGVLVEISPTYTHSFGEFIPEILEIDRIVQKELYGGE
ncbi:2-amino-4-oxopentanoate thiolase subunit OrtA [Vagococcus elongatus]|uniref:2-amino-4-ketopentanoate thiolase n=1 Tax=Vagococcus elongatus TaxID=180344 RepID=A0A430B5K0_9ENTE|nr:2-amino-4-oxopentanoate thiolase subunit OrtA [Vagococcus elongatus]RSU15603.1 2-amino-4-ketopentanoate thiolase [Vagococcus elongatus]